MRQLQFSSAIQAAFLAAIAALTIATPVARAQTQTVPQSAAERMLQAGSQEAQLKQRVEERMKRQQFMHKADGSTN
jgi:hypothetical protein